MTTGRGPQSPIPSRSRGSCAGGSPPFPTLRGPCRPRPGRRRMPNCRRCFVRNPLSYKYPPTLIYLEQRESVLPTQNFQINIPCTDRDSASRIELHRPLLSALFIQTRSPVPTPTNCRCDAVQADLERASGAQKCIEFSKVRLARPSLYNIGIKLGRPAR